MQATRLFTVLLMSFFFSATADPLESQAQTITHVPLYTFQSDNEFSSFGWSVSGAGDVNGDGFADVIVGDPSQRSADSVFSNFAGSARVFSGSDGNILHTFDGDNVGGLLGFSVSGAGDVNGDGFADVIVGAPSEGLSPQAHVFSGFDGSILHNFGPEGASLGYSVSRVGDVNGDLIPDFIVGDPFANTAKVFSGSDGSALYDVGPGGDFSLSLSRGFFGSSVSGLGDVNGDGVGDFIVGVPFLSSARVFSGSDGNVIYDLNGDGLFGASVSEIGDINGDGIDDFIVGAPGSSPYVPVIFVPLPLFPDSNGSAQVFSGSDGNVIYDLNGDGPSDNFGTSVSGVGDVNGDGIGDFIVGAPGEGNFAGSLENVIGSAQVFSGSDGSVLYSLNGDRAGDDFGSSASGAGDVNGDGIDDFIVGAIDGARDGLERGSGYARVFVSQISAPEFLLGDVNMDMEVNFLDIAPFINLLSMGLTQSEADVNQDGNVNFLDIAPFIGLLAAGP